LYPNQLSARFTLGFSAGVGLAKKEERLNHELVPPHKIMAEGDKKKVLEKYGISEAQFPKIYSSDPALTGMTVKGGDLVMISRKDSSGEYEYYRLVVKG